MGVVQPLFCRSRGGRAGVIDALDAALAAGQQPVLAVVLETTGSTYASVADLALFNANPVNTDQIGWLSGGCIERDLRLHAQYADTHRQVRWIEVDSREDADIFSGSATGCRGRLRLALLPISAMPGWRPLCQAWLRGSGSMEIEIDLQQQYVQVSVDASRCRWNAAMDVPPWVVPANPKVAARWTTRIAPIPAIRIYGAGPETPWLLPLLRATGWHTCIVESRRGWLPHAALADQLIQCTPNLLRHSNRDPVAALVMHHHFELDREALSALAAEPGVGFVGLLGPARRRDDLLRTLSSHVTDALRNRLHAPVGVAQSMRGAEAIALSVALQLQDLAVRLRDAEVAACPLPAADPMQETETSH